MSKKNIVGYVVAAAASFGLGYALQPAPQIIPVRGTPTITHVHVVPVEVPGPVRTVVVEKEPTPRPTDCLVMRWTR